MSVIKYSLKKDGEKFLSEHFQVKEFRSHVNGNVDSDEILIDEELITKLEKLMTVLCCSKAVISSGYRTKACDKAVGGSGAGMHCYGRACDICFYMADGTNVFHPNIVSCKAQDLGFTGIAKINDRYIHLDTRTNGKYYGNEQVGTNTVTNDFYEYYNIKRTNDKQYRQQVKDRFGFDNSTIEFFETHPYPEALFEKLATKK